MRALKIVVLCIAGLVVAGIVVGGFWWREHGAALMEDARAAELEGAAFGRTGTAAACVDEALKRHGPGDPELTRTLTLSFYFRGCALAAEGLDALCAQDTAQSMSGRMQWFESLCRARGVTSPTCPQIFQPLLELCGRRRGN